MLDGEGTPTRKYDGTCVMLDEDGNWWARREVKPGKADPPNFQPVTTDDNTGKTMGWEPIEQSSSPSSTTRPLSRRLRRSHLPGTYELIGPKINGNPEGVDAHTLGGTRCRDAFGFAPEPDADDSRETSTHRALGRVGGHRLASP